MSFLELLPNLVAMGASLVAMALFSRFALKMSGGDFALVMKLVTTGLFFSVFLHAGAELAEGLALLREGSLMVIMGVLITAGSASFCAAAVVGLRALR